MMVCTTIRSSTSIPLLFILVSKANGNCHPMEWRRLVKRLPATNSTFEAYQPFVFGIFSSLPS